MMLDENLDVNLDLIKFTAADRCDRCNAQAYILARRDDVSSELLFCFHHGDKHEDKLLEDGWTILEDYEARDNLRGTQMQVPV